MIDNERLECKVKAVNAAHECGRMLFNELVEIFTPLVGEKVEKQDGDLLSKIKLLIPDFSDGDRMYVFKNHSKYSLSWTVKACCVAASNICIYHDISVYIGDLENGVLTKVYPSFDARSDYTVEEVIRNREAYFKARQIANDARSLLFPFGESE